MSALGAVRPESKEPERNRAPRVGKIARGFGDYTTGLNTVAWCPYADALIRAVMP